MCNNKISVMLLCFHFCLLFPLDDTELPNLVLYRGSPNIEMDEHTFMVNRERAVDYLNSLDKVITPFFNCLLHHFNEN